MNPSLPARVKFPQWKVNLVRHHFGLPALDEEQQERRSSEDPREKDAAVDELSETEGEPPSASSVAALVEEETINLIIRDDLAVKEEDEESPRVSVSVLLAEHEGEEEVLAETPEVEGSPPLREESSAPAAEQMEAAGGEVTVEDEESSGRKEDEEQDSVSVEKFILLEETLEQCVQTKVNEADQESQDHESDIIIDITDDSEDEDENDVLPEIVVSRDLEVETGEDSPEQVVESFIEDLIQFVVEQDPEVVIEGILDEIIGRAVALAKEKKPVALTKLKKPEFQFASEDIRYRTKSTNSDDSAMAMVQCGLSLFLVSEDLQQINRFISTMSKEGKKQFSDEKSSEPKDLRRVDYSFKSSGQRTKFQEKANEVRGRPEFQGLMVVMKKATEKELGSKEKPILSEDEIMWIYSETKYENLFAGVEGVVEVSKEGSGSSSPIRFKFSKENIQLNRFLAGVLDPEKAFLGKVRKEAKVTLPLRMTSLEKNGRVIFPVEVAGVSEKELRKQEGKFGFQIIKTIGRTQSIQVDFQTSFQFYKFWTSKFARKLKKVKFSQVTL